MFKLTATVSRFLRSEDGPAATEYAVVLSLIVLAAIGSITQLGLSVSQIFDNLANAIG